MNFIIYLIVLVVLLIAVITDLRHHKVYNWLTFPALLLGLVLHIILQGWSGLFFALLGFGAGFIIFFPFYFFGTGMGAGDVKLMAVVGMFTGWEFTLNAAMYASFVGGVIAILFLLIKGNGALWKSFKNIGCFLRSLVVPKLVIEPLDKTDRLPYAVIIAGGVIAAYFLPPLLVF